MKPNPNTRPVLRCVNCSEKVVWNGVVFRHAAGYVFCRRLDRRITIAAAVADSDVAELTDQLMDEITAVLKAEAPAPAPPARLKTIGLNWAELKKQAYGDEGDQA